MDRWGQWVLVDGLTEVVLHLLFVLVDGLNVVILSLVLIPVTDILSQVLLHGVVVQHVRGGLIALDGIILVVLLIFGRACWGVL